MTYQAPEVIEVGKAENVILGCAFVGEPDDDILAYTESVTGVLDD